MAERIAKDRIDDLVAEAAGVEVEGEFALASWLMMAAVRLLEATPELVDGTTVEALAWSRHVRQRQREIEIALVECRLRSLREMRSSGANAHGDLDRQIGQAENALQCLKTE